MVKVVKSNSDLQRVIKHEKDRLEKAMRDITTDDLFNRRFMKKYTDCKDIGSFLEACGHGDCKTKQQFDALDGRDMDKEVKRHSKFNTWDEMKEKALNEYLSKNL